MTDISNRRTQKHNPAKKLSLHGPSCGIAINDFAPSDSRFLRGPFAVTHLTRSLVLGCSVLALSACGPEDIASPGTGGNITINNPPAPAPTPTPTPTGAGAGHPGRRLPDDLRSAGPDRFGHDHRPDRHLARLHAAARDPRLEHAAADRRPGLPAERPRRRRLRRRLHRADRGRAVHHLDRGVPGHPADDRRHQRRPDDRAGRDRLRRHRPVVARGQPRQPHQRGRHRHARRSSSPAATTSSASTPTPRRASGAAWC